IYYMHWVGKRLDRLWQIAHEDRDGRAFVSKIWKRGVRVVSIITTAIFAVFLLIALLVPPNTATWSLELTFSFALSALWLCYMLYSLSSVVRVQGDRSKALTEFARNSIVGAIALSIFLVLPFDQVAAGLNHAIGTILYGETRPFLRWSGDYGRNVEWLQS